MAKRQNTSKNEVIVKWPNHYELISIFSKKIAISIIKSIPVLHLIPTSDFDIVTTFDGKEKRNEQFILKFPMRNIYFRKTALVTYAPAQ